VTDTDPRITLAEDLFAAWSSGDADAPARFFHPDGILSDIVGGEHRGWPAIRDFFAKGLQRWPDLTLIPDEYWLNDRGVALRWVMGATVGDAALFGPGVLGRRWRSEGMTYLVIEEGKVRLEVDYHDSGAAPKSLGVTARPAAPAPGPADAPVGASDREAIAALVHRYADAVVRRDAGAWGAVWAEDARWVLGKGRDVTGRGAIVELWRSAMGNFEAVVQNAYNGEVTVSGDRAAGRWYIGEHFRRANGEAGILLARYDDTYVRRDGAWLFASRELVVSYQGPPDLSAPFQPTS